MVLLTDEECFDAVSVRPKGDDADWQLAKSVAKAQLKKIVEWGDSFCNIMGHNNPGEVVFKHRCPKCWQALLEEVKR